jgi:hypothetical protein
MQYLAREALAQLVETSETLRNIGSRELSYAISSGKHNPKLAPTKVKPIVQKSLGLFKEPLSDFRYDLIVSHYCSRF